MHTLVMFMLEIKNINVSYGTLNVIHDLSLEVKARETVAVLGPNCSGKTTLMKTISGLLRPRSGSIKFFDKEIMTSSPEDIAKMGVAHVPEGRRLFPFLSVVENLQIGAYTREARRKANDTLEWVFQLFPVLKERKNQLAYTLSGGEQQMLAIGRALMLRPKLLLLDEPTQGLAPIVVKNLMQKLHELKKDTTFLLAEQNAYQALNLVDRAYVLENGQIVLDGPSKELLRNEYVKRAYLG